MKLRGQAGFTLIEVIVVAAIIAILAGILVPLIFKEIDEAKTTRASADIRSISMAILVMKKDTGNWPDLFNNGGATCVVGTTMLYGGGNMPLAAAAFGYDMSNPGLMESFLSSDANACYGAQWKGPYLANVTPDPWDNAYIMNTRNFSAGGPVWILSAGPNGSVETDVAQTTAQGDDIGLRLK